MFRSLFATATSDGSISIGNTIFVMGIALLLGLVLCGTYLFTLHQKREQYSRSFALSLILLPIIVAVIIILVGSNIARAFSIAGVFSLVRFRSAPGDSKDISFIFLAMTIGLASGMGFLGLATIVTILIALLLIALSFLTNQSAKQSRTLKIAIPEDLNYEEALTEILQQYTKRYHLDRIKTINMGTLYELCYSLVLTPDCNEKAFLDALRCRNGNLSICLLLSGESQSAVPTL